VGYPRAYLDRRLRDAGDPSDAGWLLSERAMAALKDKSPEEVRKWYGDTRPYFHPGPDLKLEVDDDARALGAPIDRLEFFDKTLAALSGPGEAANRAMRLLARYAPADAGNGESIHAWEQWLKTSRSYLFFSDQGDYRWYTDPLAKKRGVPSKELRGPSRASRP
jgi:hypothetical protein